MQKRRPKEQYSFFSDGDGSQQGPFWFHELIARRDDGEIHSATEVWLANDPSQRWTLAELEQKRKPWNVVRTWFDIKLRIAWDLYLFKVLEAVYTFLFFSFFVYILYVIAHFSTGIASSATRFLARFALCILSFGTATRLVVLAIQRLHDCNLSGLWLLLLLLPAGSIAAGIVFPPLFIGGTLLLALSWLALFFLPKRDEDNQYVVNNGKREWMRIR